MVHSRHPPGLTTRSSEQLFRGVSFESLKPTVEKMLRGYLRHRQKGENFQTFTRHRDLGTLQGSFSNGG